MTQTLFAGSPAGYFALRRIHNHASAALLAGSEFRVSGLYQDLPTIVKILSVPVQFPRILDSVGSTWRGQGRVKVKGRGLRA